MHLGTQHMRSVVQLQQQLQNPDTAAVSSKP